MDELTGEPQRLTFYAEFPPIDHLLVRGFWAGALQVIEADVDPETGQRIVRKVKLIELHDGQVPEGTDVVKMTDFEWSAAEDGAVRLIPTWK